MVRGHAATCLRHDARMFGAAKGHILRTIDAATADDVAAGLDWYARAAREATALGGTLERGAGIIAALSPQCSWSRNLELAADVIDYGTCDHIPLFVSRAESIAAGAAPLDVLGGPKVRAFYCSMLAAAGRPCGRGCHNGAPVCVDRHALACAVNDRHASGNATAKVLDRKGGYSHVAALYRSAARSLAMPSWEIQATAWVAWRARHGIVDAYSTMEAF